jgi:hypothetical protein
MALSKRMANQSVDSLTKVSVNHDKCFTGIRITSKTDLENRMDYGYEDQEIFQRIIGRSRCQVEMTEDFFKNWLIQILFKIQSSTCYDFKPGIRLARKLSPKKLKPIEYPPITYYWTGLQILDHSYLVRNLTNSKIAETIASEPPKSRHFCISNFRTC